MGNCCSGETATNNGTIETMVGMEHKQLAQRMTMKQLALLIKVQANIRGFITRKRIRTMQMHAGMYYDY